MGIGYKGNPDVKDCVWVAQPRYKGNKCFCDHLLFINVKQHQQTTVFNLI